MSRKQIVALSSATILLTVFAISPAANAEPRGAETPQQQLAGELVRTALAFELEGDKFYRDMTLRSALRAEPDYAPAHWRLGRINIGGKWVSIADSQAVPPISRKRQEYLKLRGRSPLDDERDRQLANWCGAEGMDEEARAHWARLLRSTTAPESAKRQAMKELDLQSIDGQLASDEEIEAYKAALRERKALVKKWRPKLEHWRSEMLSESLAKRGNALAELRTLDEPEVIPAVVSFADEPGPAFNQEVVELLARINLPESTAALVQFALASPEMTTRERAIDELIQRPLHEVMPLLLSRLVGPIQSDVQFVTANGAHAHYRHRLRQEGVYQDREFVFDNHVITPFVGRFRVVDPNLAARQAYIVAVRDDQSIDMHNATRQLREDRIYHALEAVAGEFNPRTPDAWRLWWHDHTETTPTSKPVTYGTRRNVAVVIPPRPSISCFAAGSKVWTDEGLVAIETIRPGDRVLAQDVETGELSYRIVLDTTVRQAQEQILLRAGDEQIAVSKGHPFWVAGEGWRMAKLLEPGQQLHGLRGPVPIEAIERVQKKENVYNLIVDGRHNYFVGAGGVLVHDVTYRRPTRALLPGYTPQSSSAAD